MNDNIQLSVAKIVASTSTDGPGLRSSLYLQGCAIRCKGCHNSRLWDIADGEIMTLSEVFGRLTEADENISILGGEPLLQYRGVIELCRLIKQNTDKNIWLWSGFVLEHIQQKFCEILDWVDVIVDGPFIQELADSNLLFRGSSNQRIIHTSDLKSM